MKIYLVRHAESEFNIKGLHQHDEVSLSKTGKKQAILLKKRLSKIPFDVIISSPAKRTKETVEIINKEFKKEIIFNNLIIERKMPTELIGKYHLGKESERIRKLRRKNSNNKNWHYSDEENYLEYKERIQKFYQYLNKLDKENVLIISHAGPIRMLLFLIMFRNKEFDPEFYFKFNELFRVVNTGITVCEKENNGFWHVWTYNDHSHIKI